MVLEASSEFRAYPTHTVSLICNKAARASERGVCQDAHHGGWDPINTQSLDAAAKSAHTFCKRIHVIYRVCHCLLSREVMLIVVSNFCMDFQCGPHSATKRNVNAANTSKARKIQARSFHYRGYPKFLFPGKTALALSLIHI